MHSFDGKRITVMGLGRFGGGVGVVRWLLEQGAQCTITDLQPAAQLTDSLRMIDESINLGHATLRLGEHRAADFESADLVIANPAVPRPWQNEYLLAARNAGVPIRTEIDLVCERLNREHIIGVTGTAGKSTTAAMIHHALDACGIPAHLGGNIGGSLLSKLDHIGDNDWIVLELSSFMLHWLGEPWPKAQGRPTPDSDSPRLSPPIAVMTNLSPNHLDWHGSFEHYAACKENIFRYQREGDHAIRGSAVDESMAIPLNIPGAHNQQNARCALEAVRLATGRPIEELRDRLADFPGLPHRLELVLERDGIRFFNDSKSTTPEAAALAVRSFDDPATVHLIAGGYDKGVDLSGIASLAPSLAGLYTIGATGQAVAHAAGASAQFCETLERAVEVALPRLKPGEVLLLSPGCASWDQFTNYEERGKRFTQLVRSASQVA